MGKRRIAKGDTYQIRLKGNLNSSLIDWLGDISSQPLENGETIFVCEFFDQPALRGLLDQLWNLNLTVISVDRVEKEKSQAPEQKP